MSTQLNRHLKTDDIKKFASDYISHGIRQECWQIDDVSILNNQLSAVVSMQSHYTSGQDDLGFHLSSFSAKEFSAQLMVLYVHVQQGFSEKTREVWVVEGRIRCLRPIRNSSRIEVNMTMLAVRQRGDKAFCIADFLVSDDQGGLFKITMKVVI